jgi:cystathionine beta-lyase
MALICQRHNVFVVSDEIHCELTFPGHDYTPWATLPEEFVRSSVSCISPTKAFNIAGIQIANLFAKDPEVLKQMDRAINENECCDVNVFGVTALKAAYNQGGPWLDQLRSYLWHNARTVYCFLEDEIPHVTAPPLEGTYLMWMDCRAALCPGEPLEGFSERFAAHLRRNGLTLSTGTIYGAAGEGFERLNIACPRTRLLDALQHLRDAFYSYRYES